MYVERNARREGAVSDLFVFCLGVSGFGGLPAAAREVNGRGGGESRLLRDEDEERHCASNIVS